MSLTNLVRVPLEDWMRDYYFDTPIDIGSSGVQSFSMAELRKILGIPMEEIDGLVFNDSETLGGDRLRAAIADRWGDGDSERVMVTNGSNEAGFFIMNALVRQGDEVIALEPIYHTYDNIADALGCDLKRWPLRYENGFAPDFDELKRLITPKTQVVAVNFPHNPTGVSISRDQLDELIKIVAGVGAYLIWDAAFEELVYDVEPLPNPCFLYERAITVGTLSKGYGLPGSRIGWFFAPPEVLEAASLMRDYMSLYVSPLVELIGSYAVEGANKLLAIRMQQILPNFGILKNWIAEHGGLIDWAPPTGGVTAFPRLISVADSGKFCKNLAEQRGVMLVPGTCFKHPSHVRLGFGGPVDQFARGLELLSSFLKNWRD